MSESDKIIDLLKTRKGFDGSFWHDIEPDIKANIRFEIQAIVDQAIQEQAKTIADQAREIEKLRKHGQHVPECNGDHSGPIGGQACVCKVVNKNKSQLRWIDAPIAEEQWPKNNDLVFVEFKKGEPQLPRGGVVMNHPEDGRKHPLYISGNGWVSVSSIKRLLIIPKQ